jgi:hypothetical protein
MLILKNFFIAAIAAFALLAAIGGMTPSTAQSAKPTQDVSVVNTPTVNAQQAGTWTVGAQLPPGTTVGISGTPTVSISGTPTVNVASLPAMSVDVQPAFPAVPYVQSWNLTAAAPEVVFGHPTGTIGLTAMTLTNFESTPVQVSVSHAILASPGSCVGTVTGGTLPQFPILVQARSTLHLTYPTALVFSRIDGASCIEVGASGLFSGSVHVSVNGFRQL